MEERNIIKWSEYSVYTELTIPSGEIWMSESEMVDLFGVFIPKLRNTIQALYKRNWQSLTRQSGLSNNNATYTLPYII